MGQQKRERERERERKKKGSIIVERATPIFFI
jgi:hypothetical protein